MYGGYQQQPDSSNHTYNQQQMYQQPPPIANPQQYYPDSSQPISQNYQGHVEGLNGWNDPPKDIFLSNQEDPIISATSEPVSVIVNTLSDTLSLIRNTQIGMSQARMVDDTEKRMDELFDRLATNAISSPILAQLLHLCNAIKNKDISTASKISLSLMTSSFEQEGKWVVGLKRLIELFSRIS